MRRTASALATLAALTALLTPADVEAYGAAHVGYTHVGPNGAYHVGETAVAGPGGVAAGGRTTAGGYRGAAEVHTGYAATPYGGAAATRVYAPSYDAAHYAYVR